MSAPPKLTKKQKKAAAFRERRAGNGKAKIPDEANDIPVLEVQDVGDADSPQAEMESMVVDKKEAKIVDTTENKDKGKSRTVDNEHETVVEKKKKRKHGDTEQVSEMKGLDGGMRAPKRKRLAQSAQSIDKKGEKEVVTPVKQRFILFVGNLKYTTSVAAIQEHFAACDPPPAVRLLTPKPSSSTKPVKKSKGCAFLEFSHRNALQQGLKLHQSELEGRMINVELTAGGGGRSENRITKVRERNKELFGQRTERIAKQGLDEPNPPQRYSATSGIEQLPVTRRTWTVGDIDDGEVHRGGKRHTKNQKTKRSNIKTWGTGVNAIPVG